MAAPRLVGYSCPELERTSLGPQGPPSNLIVSGACAVSIEKTGHVLVRTSHSRGQPKGQRFQSSKSAMSGGLKFVSEEPLAEFPEREEFPVFCSVAAGQAGAG